MANKIHSSYQVPVYKIIYRRCGNFHLASSLTVMDIVYKSYDSYYSCSRHNPVVFRQIFRFPSCPSSTANLSDSTPIHPPTNMPLSQSLTSSSSVSNGNALMIPALAPGPPDAATSSSKGALVCTILSAYDLPAREQPICIALAVCGEVVTSGPPSARHKDRNSFKFAANNILRLEAPLSAMYNEKATVIVRYRDESKNLAANVLVNSLKVHETSWLILNLPTNDEIAPTLRLEFRLEGPYRPEIGALLAVSSKWFQLMDYIECKVDQVLRSLPTMPNANYLLIPAIPIATALVVFSPIVVGIAIAGLPLLLPILVLLSTIILILAGASAVLYASTSSGREKVASVMAPAFTYVISSQSGQALLYDTGSRPTPVSLARWILPTDSVGKFIVSLLIDLMGSSSYLLPIVGEGLDLGWAPIQTILIMAMYDDVAPNLKYLSFFEEILPLTDVVPSATMGWLVEFGPTLLHQELETKTHSVVASH